MLNAPPQTSQFENLPDLLLLRIQELALPIQTHRVDKYPYAQEGAFHFRQFKNNKSVLSVTCRVVSLHLIEAEDVRLCINAAFFDNLQTSNVRVRNPFGELCFFDFTIPVEPTKSLEVLFAECKARANKALRSIVKNHITTVDAYTKSVLYIGDSRLSDKEDVIQLYLPFEAGVFVDTQSNLSVLSKEMQRMHKTQVKPQRLPFVPRNLLPVSPRRWPA